MTAKECLEEATKRCIDAEDKDDCYYPLKEFIEEVAWEYALSEEPIDDYIGISPAQYLYYDLIDAVNDLREY